jgi:N-acetylglucosamine-6-phosphate deacetylase
MASFAWTADEIAEHLLELGNAMAAEAAVMTSGEPARRLELASA